MNKKYSFKAAYWEITRRCNLACEYCMASSNCPRLVKESHKRELSYDEAVNLVLKPARELGCDNIAFSGGEPFVREDFLDLIEAARKLDYSIKIISNGLGLSEELLAKLKKMTDPRFTIAFGINSISDEAVHKATRGTELDRTLRAIELCKKMRIARHVIVTVGKFNLADLDTTLDWLQNNGLSFNRAPFVPRGSGVVARDQMFDREDLKQVIFPALSKRINGYVSYVPFFLSPELHAEISGNLRKNITVPQNPSIACWTGSWLTFSAEGDVSICPTLVDTLVAGNVREKSLYEIIDTSPLFQNILHRDRLKGKCGRCRYHYTCGGCRSLAYYYTGDYMEADPTCFFEPEDRNTKSEYEDIINKTFEAYALLAVFAGQMIEQGY